MRKLTEEECHKRLEGRTLRMVEYGGVSSEKCLFICNLCNHEWNTYFHNVSRGSGCPKCAGVAKLTETECYKRLEGKPINMISFVSTNSGKSTFQCSVCFYKWKTLFNSISQGGGCPRCLGKVRVTEEECRKRLEGRPIKIIFYDGKVMSNKSIFECDICNHLWSASFNSVYRISGCPKCCNHVPLTEDDCKARLEYRNIEMLFYDVNTNSRKSKFKCKICSCIWSTSFNNIDFGKGCPSCAKYGFNPSKPAWLYVLLLDTPQGSCYGFGITNRIEERMRLHRKNLGSMLEYEYPPFYFDSGAEAQKLEIKWKQNFNVVNIQIEGFKTECVLVNTETTRMIFGQ